MKLVLKSMSKTEDTSCCSDLHILCSGLRWLNIASEKRLTEDTPQMHQQNSFSRNPQEWKCMLM